MTLSHIEQLEWGVCLVAWCALCGCGIKGVYLDGERPGSERDIVCMAYGLLAISAGVVCLWYGIVYAAWRT